MMNRRLFVGLLAASPLLTRPAYAAATEIFADDGLAIRGIDPVAYFDGGGPVAGVAAHALMWRGAEWRFHTAQNMLAFEMDPDRFCPKYGGYCAYALAQGALASTDPAAWTIYKGHLYLNYSDYVRGQWSTDIPGNIAKADPYWPAILTS